MKFEIGDKVIVKHSNEEAEVIDIINKEMVMVDVRGVKFPAYVDQLDSIYTTMFTGNKPVQKPKGKIYIDQIPKEKVDKKEKKHDGVWITFLPVMELDIFGDEVVEYFKIYLSNRTKDLLKFTYKLNYFGSTEFDLLNQVNPFDEFYIHDVSLESMNDNPVFSFDFSLFNADKKKADHFESSLKLKAKQIFTKIEEVRKSGQASFSYNLFEEYPYKTDKDYLDMSKLSSKGYKVYDASQIRQNLEPSRSVVDLHIEKLTDDWKGLSNFEILTIQLSNFEKYFDLAFQHRMPNLIIIHGVGSGKLKNEIHEILKLKSEVKSFVNRYHPLYGDGSTEIYFQY